MILNINKPIGLTSHTIVNKVRRLYNEKRVGHAGTLDPFASGVLIVMVGREDTKKSDLLMHQEKEYVAQLKLGYLSTTYDTEGDITEYDLTLTPTLAQIEQAITPYIGEIDQIPPMYSAIKIKGQKLYDLARKGIEIERPARRVIINDINIVDYIYPLLTIKVVCGSGVYIRSLAFDIGNDLKTGAYLVGLTRTRIGDFKIEDTLVL